MVLTCAVCKENKPKLKILPCDHEACFKCVTDALVQQPLPDQNDPKVAGDTAPITNGVSATADPTPETEKVDVPSAPTDTESNEETVKTELKPSRQIVKCAQCSVEHVLTGFNGLKDLDSRFSGDMRCWACSTTMPLAELMYCKRCEEPVCMQCLPKKHGDHGTPSPAVLQESAGFCMAQLDGFSKLHVELTQMQKTIVTEYLKYIETAIFSTLDADLCTRVKRFKDQKRWLSDTYDVKDIHSNRPGIGNAKLVDVFGDLSRISPSPSQFCKPLPKEGPIFKTLPVAEVVEKFMDYGKLSLFAPDFSFRKPISPDGTPVSGTGAAVAKFVGAGIINDPSDLTLAPEIDTLFVSCRSQGLLRFSLKGDHPLTAKMPMSEEKAQLSCMDHMIGSKFGVMTSLDGFCQWALNVSEIQKLGPHCRLPIPNVGIGKSWYRWVSLASEMLAVVTTGDEHLSAVWVADLVKGIWYLMAQEKGSTFRRASVQTLDTQYRIFVPDMQRKRIAVITVDRTSLEVVRPTSDLGDLTTESLPEYLELPNVVDMPVCTDFAGHKLFIGYWKTGGIYSIKVGKEKTLPLPAAKPEIRHIASAGERELLSFRVHLDTVFALCKQKELVQVHKFM